MGNKRSRKRLGLLSRQKPNRKNSKSWLTRATGFAPRFVIVSALGVLVFAGIYRISTETPLLSSLWSSSMSEGSDEPQKKKKKKKKQIPKRASKKPAMKHKEPRPELRDRIIIKPEDGYEISSRERTLLDRKARKGYDGALSSIARSVHEGSTYGIVHVFRPEPGTVVVKPFRRKPFAAVDAGGLRFLTEDGIVYGKPGAARERSDLTLITGIFGQRDKKSKRVLNSESNSLSLSEKERKVIAEGIELIKELAKNSLEASQIRFDPYRGFVVKIVPSHVEIYLGRAPFTARFARLAQILDNLRLKGVLYSRIELDYDGKAFVRESPIEPGGKDKL